MGKKKKPRKSYSVELKRKAVELSNQPGVTVADVADQLDVPPQQLSQWRAKFKNEDASEEVAKKLSALEENRKLKEQLKQVRMENEILKKAAAYFASQK